MTNPLERLRHHVTGAIERGEATPIERQSIDEQTARRRLTARWHEQVELDPAMRERAPLELYIKRNLRVTMRDGLLAEYQQA